MVGRPESEDRSLEQWIKKHLTTHKLKKAHSATFALISVSLPKAKAVNAAPG